MNQAVNQAASCQILVYYTLFEFCTPTWTNSYILQRQIGLEWLLWLSVPQPTTIWRLLLASLLAPNGWVASSPTQCKSSVCTKLGNPTIKWLATSISASCGAEKWKMIGLEFQTSSYCLGVLVVLTFFTCWPKSFNLGWRNFNPIFKTHIF